MEDILLLVLLLLLLWHLSLRPLGVSLQPLLPLHAHLVQGLFRLRSAANKTDIS